LSRRTQGVDPNFQTGLGERLRERNDADAVV